MDILGQSGVGNQALDVISQALSAEMTKLLVLLSIFIILMVVFIFWVINKMDSRQGGESDKSLNVLGDMVEINRDQNKWLQSINASLQVFPQRITDGFIMVSGKIDTKSELLEVRLNKDFDNMDKSDKEILDRLDKVQKQLEDVMAIVTLIKESKTETLMNRPPEVDNELRNIRSIGPGAIFTIGSSVHPDDPPNPGGQISNSGNHPEGSVPIRS